jgi:hypothetical protein
MVSLFISTGKEEIGEKTVLIAGKNGLQFELSYSSEVPNDTNEEDAKKWHSIAVHNVEKLKDDLSQSESESQEIINGTVEEVKGINEDEEKAREKRSMQIK